MRHRLPLVLLLLAGCRAAAPAGGKSGLDAAVDAAAPVEDALAQDAPLQDASVDESPASDPDSAATDVAAAPPDIALAHDVPAIGDRSAGGEAGATAGRCAPVDLPPEVARMIVVADVDGDGHLDILGGGETGELMLRRGTGTRKLEDPRALLPTPPKDDYQGLVVADFDGDGIPDIGAGSYRGWMFTLRGLGQGQLGPRVDLDLSPLMQIPLTIQGFAGGDLDGDGHVDLVTLNSGPFDNENSLIIWWGKGDGTFSAPGSFPVCHDPTYLHVVDVDGDGHAEVFVGCVTGAQDMYRVGQDRSPKRILEQQYFAAASVFADLDQDGHVDMVSTSPLDNELGLIIRLGDGKGSFAAQTGLGPRPRRRAREILVADFDGDGTRDLAVTHFDEPPAVSFLTGARGLTFTASAPLPVSWNVINSAAGDLDEDGKADLVVARWGKGLTVFFGPCP